MKREFNMSYKQDIIDGKVKVVTKDNRPVEILKWNRIDDEGRHIIALIHHSDECEDVYHFYEDGRCDDMYGNDAYNLYVLTDEPEPDDEKIRKFLKLIIGEWSYDDLSAKGFKKENIIAWLEKQGEQKPKRMVSAEAKEAMYDRPAWSEEDQETIDYLIDYLEDKLDCSYTDLDKETFTKEITLLKSIRPQNTWKPSDEQMRVLDLAIICGINRGTTEETTLISLFNDLKKLKEE